jgi:CRP/FNR family nitrogen fixation transcriptional regulator
MSNAILALEPIMQAQDVSTSPVANFFGTGRLETLDIAQAPGMDPFGVAGIRMSHARNAEIFGEGEPATCAYRVLKGVVRTIRFLADGRRQIVEFFLPGEVFGLEFGLEHRISAEAVTDCDVMAMRRSHLSARAANDNGAAQKLLATTLHHLHRAEEHMLVLGRKIACERVAWFLIDMAERIPAPNRIDLPMSRQDIADFLGLTIETVSRTMTQLQDEGIIELPSFRHVVLRDRETLMDIAA